jgi:hypothetical protein
MIHEMFYVQLKKCKIDANNRDFADMRRRLTLNAQIKIAYFWKRYVKRKAQAKIRERLDAEARRKAEKERKTKGGSQILVQTIKYKESKGLSGIEEEKKLVRQDLMDKAIAE